MTSMRFINFKLQLETPISNENQRSEGLHGIRKGAQRRVFEMQSRQLGQGAEVCRKRASYKMT